ncbi:MAG: gliding motility-associated C-terminal domain-containing protein [Flavobacteriales bacterium]
MKNLDNHIQDILNSKLGNLETEVSPHVWSGIESQLAQQAAAAGSATVAKTIATKWLWAAAISAAVTVATVAIVQINKNQQPIAAPATENTVAPVTDNSAALPTNSESPSSEVVGGKQLENSQTNVGTNTQWYTSTGTEHEVEMHTDLSSHPESIENPGSPNIEIHGTVPSGQDIPPSTGSGQSASNSSNTQDDNTIEIATAKFSPVVVNQKELRYFFIPEYTKGAQYAWNMGDGNTYSTANPTHEFADENEYLVQLTVTDPSGKSYSESITVKAFEPLEVKIPTIFTPNGDGINDVFEFEILSGQVEWNKIVILNQHGSVFESNGDQMWTGLDKQGNECAEWTYTYLVRGRDRNQAVVEKTGSVTLRRSR